ncbi:MAG: RsmB/NOP family class I SAM-dependent RNA methyltransferase [Marinibacterium sp.]|nr:RsmB/NOP family class I SAM-dependent RNA methyltransferase [Marinibacterium sp.]
MTPGARVAAAIDILDDILSGRPAEQCLTNWARRSRFAGSKDRAAIRDHVFDALRCKRSFAAQGGAMTGRGLMIGAQRAGGLDPSELFTGDGHAPAPLGADDPQGRDPRPGAEALDLPDWLWPRMAAQYGDGLAPIGTALQHRAPVHLRVNLRKGDLAVAQAALAGEGIITEPHPASASALEVTEGARRLRQSRAYQDGLVELQDAASQAVVDSLPLTDGMQVLDLCAGGGGKSLAMAARARLTLSAHDKFPQRMRDLPERARRAGVKVEILKPGALRGGYDLVLCDVPCSGSGAWRRNPEGKWLLDDDALQDLTGVQAGILDDATRLVRPGGVLVYVTCSLLRDENDAQVDAFLARHPGWQAGHRQSWVPGAGTDGFYCAHLTRA